MNYSYLNCRLNDQQIKGIEEQMLEKYPEFITQTKHEYKLPEKTETEEELINIIKSTVEQRQRTDALETEINQRKWYNKDTYFPQYSLSLIIEATANKKLPERILVNICEFAYITSDYNEANLIRYTKEGLIGTLALWHVSIVPYSRKFYKSNIMPLLYCGIHGIIKNYWETNFPDVDIPHM